MDSNQDRELAEGEPVDDFDAAARDWQARYFADDDEFLVEPDQPIDDDDDTPLTVWQP